MLKIDDPVWFVFRVVATVKDTKVMVFLYSYGHLGALVMT